MKRRLVVYLGCLLVFSPDAWAWGLQTHSWFAQALIWLVPLADPALRRAARRLPRLVLAGAALPDLVLTSGRRIPLLGDSHEWDTSARLLAAAGSDEERALALGFSSHLLTDIIAHNHFVPVHERVWLDAPLLTHVAAEWAMDHSLKGQIFLEPALALAAERETLTRYVADSFDCPADHARSALLALERAERLLRVSGLPALAMRTGLLADRRLQRRFRHYLNHTVRRLEQINRLAAGERPLLSANPCPRRAQEALATMPMRLMRSRMPLPADLFAAG
jgi:hypothetical protein